MSHCKLAGAFSGSGCVSPKLRPCLRPGLQSSRDGPRQHLARAGSLVDGIQTGTGLGIALGIAISSIPILSGEARELNERKYLQPTEEDTLGGIRWGVMSVLSCIPYLSPLAWVFAALDDEIYSSLYFSYAALYTLPYLTNGFRLNSFVLLSIAAGIAHVQIERLAMTEPVEVVMPEVLGWLARHGSRALSSLLGHGAPASEGKAGRASTPVPPPPRLERRGLTERSADVPAELDHLPGRSAKEGDRDGVDVPRGRRRGS